MNSSTASRLEVQARWAYSEIVESNAATAYDNFHDIEALRSKRNEGVQFGKLTSEDCYNLAFACACVRSSLMMYLTGVEFFQEIQLSKSKIEQLLVPANISHQHQLVSFAAFMTIPTESRGDARNVTANPNGYQRSNHPLTIGLCYKNLILIDGYHRAADFLKFAPPDTTIDVYMPT